MGSLSEIALRDCGSRLPEADDHVHGQAGRTIHHLQGGILVTKRQERIPRHPEQLYATKLESLCAPAALLLSRPRRRGGQHGEREHNRSVSRAAVSKDAEMLRSGNFLRNGACLQ